MIKRIKILILISIVAIFQLEKQAYGQLIDLQNNRYFVEPTYSYGFLMPHHSLIEYLVEDHIQSFGFRIGKQASGDKLWHQLYRYPNYGFGFHHSNLSNNNIFGKVTAGYGFMSIPLIKPDRRFMINYQIGFGLSYITNHYDVMDNYQNLAIGSNFNIYFDLSLQTGVKLTDEVYLRNNIQFIHFSNGKMASPNKGLNLVTTSLGIQYQFGNKQLTYKTLQVPVIENKNSFEIFYSASTKMKSRFDENYYFVSSLAMEYHRQYHHKRNWGAGLDLFFDASIREDSDKTDKKDFLNSDLYQLGVHLSHDFCLDRLALVIQIGTYLYAPIEPEGPIYTRIGLRYKATDRISANLTLKSHYAIASFIEFGVGYRFKSF